MDHIQEAGFFDYKNRRYTVKIHFNPSNRQIDLIEITLGIVSITKFTLSEYDETNRMHANALIVAKLAYDNADTDPLIEDDYWPEQAWPADPRLTTS